MTDEEIGTSTLNAMKQRTEAKQIIACAEKNWRRFETIYSFFEMLTLIQVA